MSYYNFTVRNSLRYSRRKQESSIFRDRVMPSKEVKKSIHDRAREVLIHNKGEEGLEW
jgi:hypothetical protein